MKNIPQASTIVLVVLTTANFGGFSNFCRYYTRSQAGKSTGYRPTLKPLISWFLTCKSMFPSQEVFIAFQSPPLTNKAKQPTTRLSSLKICCAKVTNDVKILAESLIIRKIQYIVINYITIFVFEFFWLLLFGSQSSPCMSSLNRGPSKDASYKVLIHLA